MLTEDTETLREELRQVRKEFARDLDLPSTWPFSRIEGRIVMVLLQRDVASVDQIALRIGSTPASVYGAIIRLRPRLKEIGAQLLSKYGVGFYIPVDDRKKLRAKYVEDVRKNREIDDEFARIVGE